MLDKDIPGPGKYSSLRAFGSDALKFSMFSRSGNSGLVDFKKNVPGPGSYKITNDPTRTNPTMKSLVNITWSKSKDTRFMPLSNDIALKIRIKLSWTRKL
jgi:hypothetical protein